MAVKRGSDLLVPSLFVFRLKNEVAIRNHHGSYFQYCSSHR
jgi:hypothetical protein